MKAKLGQLFSRSPNLSSVFFFNTFLSISNINTSSRSKNSFKSSFLVSISLFSHISRKEARVYWGICNLFSLCWQLLLHFLELMYQVRLLSVACYKHTFKLPTCTATYLNTPKHVMCWYLPPPPPPPHHHTPPCPCMAR